MGDFIVKEENLTGKDSDKVLNKLIVMLTGLGTDCQHFSQVQ